MSTESIWSVIELARSKGAQRLLLKGGCRPIIDNIQGRQLLSDDPVPESNVLSFSIQLLKMSGRDPDIRQFTNVYLKLNTKKWGALRAEILCQQERPILTLELSEAPFPEMDTTSATLPDQLSMPGLHIISGRHATLSVFRLIDEAAEQPHHHPVLLSRGRPYALSRQSSHIEVPFDCPTLEEGLPLLPHVMPSHIGLILPPTFLGHPSITNLAHRCPVWQSTLHQTHQDVLQAMTVLDSFQRTAISGILDDTGYHSLQSE